MSTKYIPFENWMQQNRSQIEDQLRDAGIAFINANAVNCNSISELLLGDWQYLDEAKSQGYKGNFEPTKNGKSINLNLTYHQFKGTISIPFTDSYQVINKMWEDFKKDHPFTPTPTVSEALDQYNQLSTTGTSQYLTTKQCQPTPGIKFGPDFIAIPMHGNDTTIKSIQLIYADGTKLFAKGTKKNGLYFPIGDQLRHPGSTGQIVICEGLATGLTLWESEDLYIKVAFDAGNILHLVAQTRKDFPYAEIIIAADNDHKTRGNPGLKKAHAAALKYDCKVTYPNFDDDDKGTDFNDLCVSKGTTAVEDHFYQNLYTPKKPIPKTKPLDPTPTEASGQELRATGFNLTDVGNSERFGKWHQDQVKYCHELNNWFAWDGAKWARDEGEIIGLGIDTVRRIHAEATDPALNPEDVQQLTRHALKSENVSRIKGLITLSQAQCRIKLDQFDTHKMVINVGNGILDLTDGRLHPHDPNQNHSKIAGANYDQNATCPTWLAFLDKIFAHDLELINFIQRAVGYSLTADISEQSFLILWGNGNNGKSTFTDTIGALLGDYTRVAAPDIFMRNKINQHPTEIADLKGARFVSSEESDKNVKLNEGRIKMMTGTKKIKARMMRQDFFEFEQEYKLWFATNHKPVITGTDTGIWRRIQLVPFDVKIPDHEVDKHLLKKLDGELSGILKWAVEGCLAWQRDGIQTPGIVTAATEEYRQESDILGNFIGDCCYLNPNVRVKTGELYSCYEQWCEENGDNSISNREFGKQIKERGINRKRSNNVYYYFGLDTNLRGLEGTEGTDVVQDYDYSTVFPAPLPTAKGTDFQTTDNPQSPQSPQSPQKQSNGKNEKVVYPEPTHPDYDENPGPNAKLMSKLVNAFNNDKFKTCEYLLESLNENEIKELVAEGLLKVCDNEDYLELCL